MLTHLGMAPTATASGFLALAELRRASGAAHPYPLVLIDALMPEMDGFALVERIRAEPILARATILMLSSSDRSADIIRCRELGVTAYLVKPLNQSELLDAILMALGSPPLGEPELPRNDALAMHESGRKLHILLAEDNEINQLLAGKLLEIRGHTVVAVNNGREALVALKREPFDVVLMDIQMPEMDGLTATAAIRENERSTGRHVPIVALTAHAMRSDRERCLAAGMDDYVTKPLRANQLFAALARLIPLGTEPVHAALMDSQRINAAATSGGPTIDATMDGTHGESGFDLTAALYRTEGDMGLLRKMVQLFTTQSAKLLGEIGGAIGREDGQALERAAHKLKGSIGNFGAHKASETAQRLETMGHRNELIGAGTASAELKREIASLQSALAGLVKEKVT